MSSRDPYAGRYQQNYGDGPEYDPYYASQPRPTYEQSGYEGYRDEPALPVQPSDNTLVDRPGVTKERSGFDQEFSRPQKTSQNLRAWRYEHQGNIWARGGRGRCIGRFCCCTLLIAAFLIVSILLSLALWARPPNISINNVAPPTTGSTIQAQTGGLTINLGVNISVENPNYFSVDFKQIKAQIFYPINNTAIGGGEEDNINFASHSQTNFTFPFSIDYQQSLDPGNKILIDLATKCGFLGGAKSDITVNYKLTLGLRVLFVTISPVISNSFNFACPLTEADVEPFLQGSGLNIPGLT